MYNLGMGSRTLPHVISKLEYKLEKLLGFFQNIRHHWQKIQYENTITLTDKLI